MAKAKLYNQAGEEKGEVKLNPEIFEVPAKQDLIHQNLVAILANKRQVLAHAKDRSEVRGGGKKPWRQKGTGRARAGSSRSPIWIGGGVTFGPTKERNFSKSINKKMKRKGLFMVLSDKSANNALAVVEELKFEKPQTKLVRDFLKKTNLENALIVIEKMDQNIVRSIRNIAKTDVVAANSINIYDLLKYKNVIFTKQALAEMENTYHVTRST